MTVKLNGNVNTLHMNDKINSNGKCESVTKSFPLYESWIKSVE